MGINTWTLLQISLSLQQHSQDDSWSLHSLETPPGFRVMGICSSFLHQQEGFDPFLLPPLLKKNELKVLSPFPLHPHFNYWKNIKSFSLSAPKSQQIPAHTMCNKRAHGWWRQSWLCGKSAPGTDLSMGTWWNQENGIETCFLEGKYLSLPINVLTTKCNFCHEHRGFCAGAKTSSACSEGLRNPKINAESWRKTSGFSEESCEQCLLQSNSGACKCKCVCESQKATDCRSNTRRGMRHSSSYICLASFFCKGRERKSL